MRDKLKSWLLEKPNQYLLLGLIALLVLAILWPRQEQKTEVQQAVEADTVIPAGFVLVPIELLNFEALSALVGSYAIVDLFAPNTDPNQRPRKIGSDLRLLRAPLNPNQFAVLVPENESDLVVSQATPLIAVIQNRSKNEQTKLLRTKSQKKSRIELL